MGFDDFPVYPTRYRLDDVWLWYCNFDYPVLRRGVKPLEVVFYQPGEMYEELKGLTEKGLVSLTVYEADRKGKKRITEIKGLIVKEVYPIHDGIDGCRVTLSDLRELIDLEPWSVDVNLVVHGLLVPGTFDESAAFVYRLTAFLRDKVFTRAPFSGRMRGDWEREAGLADPNFIPFDSHLSGGLPSDVLQALLERWALDLTFDTDARFGIGRRVVAGGADQGIAQFARIDMEWADREPAFGRHAKSFLRARNYRVPAWQIHTLQVWHNPPPAKAPAGLGREAADSGLELVPTYKAMEDYWSMKGLLEAAGVTWSLPAERDLRRWFLRKGLRYTILTTAFEDSAGIADRPRRLMLGHAVVESERRLFQLRRRAGARGDESSGGGPGEWLDIELGRGRADGTIVPTRAHGPWTLLFNKPEVVHQRAETVFTGPQGLASRRYSVVFGRVFDDDDAKAVEGLVLGGDPSQPKPVGSSTLDAIPFDGTEAGMRRNKFRWTLDHGNPFTARWESKPGLVIRLEADGRDIGALGRAVLGKPIEGHLDRDTLLGGYLPWMRRGFVRNPQAGELSDAEKRAIVKGEVSEAAQEVARDIQLDGVRMQEDLQWELDDFRFYILVTARQNFPNNENKFWMTNVPGFADAALDEITLLPTDRVYLRRQYADRQGRAGFEGDLEFGWGKPLNDVEVAEEAKRRVAAVMALAIDPQPVEAKFYNIKALKRIRLTGSLDQVVLSFRGPQVYCTVYTGSRADDNARLIEAQLQRGRAMAEFSGKIAKR